MIPRYLLEMHEKISRTYQTPLPKPSKKEMHSFTLAPIQKEWVKWAFLGGERLLLGARGYGKTESIVLHGLFQKILSCKTLTARIYTRNYEDAKDLLRVLGNLLVKSGCSGVFSSTQIILKENTTKEPTVSLKSILSKAHKGKHVNWVIFDDPVDLMDEFSPLLLKRVKTIYQNLSSIAKKGVITIGQYVCSGDLYTELEKLIPTRGYWHGSFPKRDKDLSQLRSSGKSEEFIHANYLGVLLPSANRPFERMNIGYSPQQSYYAACLDPSLMGKDYTALSVMQIQGYQIWVRVHLFKASYIDCFDDIVNLLEVLGVQVLSYEDNIIGDAAFFTFQKIQNIRVYPFRSTQNKVQKILQLEPYIKPNSFNTFQIFFDQNSDPVALEQIRFWSPLKSDYDDAPDSVAMLLLQQRRNPHNKLNLTGFYNSFSSEKRG